MAEPAICELCGLPFLPDERRSLFGTHHELPSNCIRRLRAETERQNNLLYEITIAWTGNDQNALRLLMAQGVQAVCEGG